MARRSPSAEPSDPIACLNAWMARGDGAAGPRWRRYYEPVPQLSRGAPLPILGIMVLVWQLRRDDLQALYPLDSEAGRLDFIAWCLLHGRREYRALEEAGALWRALARPARFAGPPLAADDAGHAISWKMLLMVRGRPDLDFDGATVAGRAALLLWALCHAGRELGAYCAALAPWQLAFLQSPGAASGGAWSRVQELVYAQRADVRAAYPLPAGAAAYLAWFARFAADETPLSAPAAMDDEPGPGPGPAAAATLRLPAGVNVVGHAYGQLGIGEDARMAVRALDSGGIAVTLLDAPPGPRIPRNERSMAGRVGTRAIYGSNLFCLTALEQGRYVAEHGCAILEGRRNIGYWPWELAAWPEQWRHLFALVDEVWSSSEHTWRAALGASPVPVRQLPMAVELPAPSRLARGDFGLPPRACLFLFTFDLNSSARRKNPQACVQAFLAAFPRTGRDALDAERVGLVIKVHPPAAPEPEWQALKALHANDPRIHLIERTLDKGDLLALCHSCDCFISLHRAEGFGRGIAEAMLLGKPVIATGYSGNLAFTDQDNALLVPYALTPLRAGDYPFGEGQCWAEADVAAAARLMRQVLAEPAATALRAARGRATVVRRHGAGVVGAAYAAALAPAEPDAARLGGAAPRLDGRGPALLICDAAASGPAGHYLHYTLCLAGAGRRLGMAVRVLCQRALAAAPPALDGVAFHAAYAQAWRGADLRQLPRFGPGHPVADTLAALDALGAGAADLVLVHTLGLLEMQAWLDWLVELAPARLRALPAWRFVLRFDPAALEGGAAPGWGALRRRLGARQAELAQRVRWFADTERLAARYTALLGLPVALAPIPFDQRPLLAALRRGGVRRRPAGPATALYLGDARPEKGIEALPALARALWTSHLRSGRLRLVVQANLNLPGGQGGAAEAVRALAGYPAPMVELIHAPMAPVDYYRRLAEADIVLLPYDAAAYRARSSGICVEALAAGKPIVTTAGSWMASQAGPEQAELIDGAHALPAALAALLERLPAAASAARRAAPRWRRAADPLRCLRQLLAEAPPSPPPSLPAASFDPPPAGHGSLAALIGACRPTEPQWRWPPPRLPELAPGQADAIALDGRVDLLYVGSARPGEVAGLRDFLDAVYFPHLAALGVTLVVAGAVCGAAPWPSCRTLLLVGTLADPAPLQAAAAFCILPAAGADGGDVRALVEALRRMCHNLHDASPAPPPAWTPAWLLANRLLLAWLGDGWHAAVPADGLAPTALPQAQLRALLALALPAVLASAACDGMPAAARRYLCEAPERAVATLLTLAGVLPPPSAPAPPGAVRATLVAHGALEAQLLVRLSRPRPQGPAPRLALRCAGAPLAPAALAADGPQHASCRFVLPLERGFPYFQLLDVLLELAPAGGWRIDSVLLHQFAGTALLERPALQQLQPQLHAAEADADGGRFAWTAQPSLALALPCWRGGDSVVMLQTAGLGRHAPADVALRAGATPLALHCADDGHGALLSATLAARPAWPFEPLWRLDAPHVEQAAAGDERLIGLALRGIALVAQPGLFPAGN
ncbi:glycosyltransferase [Rugamonas rubra]|uniref:Glycosyltransferase involved in cell wall bisynthesis n=1 Tax=Rugamonas rubra TaxID=758825 RepID=A0A1I4N0Q8_9BURK|nr:glycosyltransferase [Rugamonas rubra]SFM08800.1 Glycosyltransferase involved in cell wall bisynthesis [Rugamonas rubra]